MQNCCAQTYHTAHNPHQRALTVIAFLHQQWRPAAKEKQEWELEPAAKDSVRVERRPSDIGTRNSQ